MAEMLDGFPIGPASDRCFASFSPEHDRLGRASGILQMAGDDLGLGATIRATRASSASAARPCNSCRRPRSNVL